MAGRPQNRIELRRQYEAAEPPDPVEDEAIEPIDDLDEGDEEERRPKKKKAAPRPRATKPAKPAARMRIVWTVVNDAFKTVATFEYSKKDEALARAAELTAKGKGVHFLQKVKEPMPDDAPGLGANLPREQPPTPARKSTRKAAAPVAEDEEDEVDTDADTDVENDADADADDDFNEEDEDD